MDRLHKLLFELSSVERIIIITELQKGGLKLSQLSRKLDLTLTETSRHLERLCGAKLVQKHADGRFGLAPFGALALTLLSSLGFASKHPEYFTEYDASRLPLEFVERIGELEGSVYEAGALKNLEEGVKRIQEAREFVWILSDEVLSSSIPPLTEKVKRAFELRIILPEGKFPPESQSRLPLTTLRIQKRTISQVAPLIVLTEKAAIFCLPTQHGKIDYTGFTGTDFKFHKWCKDLFQHYWEKSKPIPPM